MGREGYRERVLEKACACATTYFRGLKQCFFGLAAMVAIAQKSFKANSFVQKTVRGSPQPACGVIYSFLEITERANIRFA